MSDIHETILQQIDHQKPAHLVPGKDIGAEIKDARAILVTVPSMKLQATVEYVPGVDLYNVEILRDDALTAHERVYCDQLGPLLFGDEALPWTAPMGGLMITDENGKVVEEHTW